MNTSDKHTSGHHQVVSDTIMTSDVLVGIRVSLVNQGTLLTH